MCDTYFIYISTLENHRFFVPLNEIILCYNQDNKELDG